MLPYSKDSHNSQLQIISGFNNEKFPDLNHRIVLTIMGEWLDLDSKLNLMGEGDEVVMGSYILEFNYWMFSDLFHKLFGVNSNIPLRWVIIA